MLREIKIAAGIINIGTDLALATCSAQRLCSLGNQMSSCSIAIGIALSSIVGAAIVYQAPSKAQPASGVPTLSDRASFDCTKGGSMVANILCGSHEGASADWDLNSTLWPIAGTNTEAQQQLRIKPYDHLRQPLR
jgi:hypothetical protein